MSRITPAVVVVVVGCYLYTTGLGKQDSIQLVPSPAGQLVTGSRPLKRHLLQQLGPTLQNLVALGMFGPWVMGAIHQQFNQLVLAAD